MERVSRRGAAPIVSSQRLHAARRRCWPRWPGARVRWRYMAGSLAEAPSRVRSCVLQFSLADRSVRVLCCVFYDAAGGGLLGGLHGPGHPPLPRGLRERPHGMSAHCRAMNVL